MAAPAQIRFGGESPSLDELAGGTPAQINCQVDAAGAVRMRPGLSAWEDFPDVIPNASPVTQILAWKGYVAYVTDDRKLWAWTTPGNVNALSDATATTKLDGGTRPVMTSMRDRLIVAGGGKPQKWEGAGLSARLGGAPPNFTHVTTISQRVVGNANDPSGLIYWSGVGLPESWTIGLDFREAETKQDPVIGLYENANELACLGTETIQMLSPDPSETFTPSRTIEVGWGSPYSYIAFDEIFAGLDSRDRAILCNGRSFDVISSPWIGEQLARATTTDAWGFRYKFHNWDLGAFVLPTDGRTFVYDAGGKLWTQWSSYDAATGGYGKFDVTSAYYWPEQKITLVGLPDGRVAKLDPDATTDLGEPIVCQLTSTFENRNSSRLKLCEGIRIRFKRGILPVDEVAHVLVSYRDDLGAFCEPFRIDIGDPNDVAPVVEIRSLGTYRQRQWRIVVDSAAFRFAGMEEDFATLEH